MTYRCTDRWGKNHVQPNQSMMQDLLSSLETNDPEHSEVALTHETEWSLGVYPSGTIVWENLEEGTPRHMKDIPRAKALELWIKLSQGDIDEINQEPWLPGYQ